MRNTIKALCDFLEKGQDVVLCSVVAASGSTPRGAGAKMMVLADGSATGTIGGGAVEHRAVELATRVHQDKGSFVEQFDLSDSAKADLGMICGGNTTVYFQYFASDDPHALAFARAAARQVEANEDAWLITEIAEDGQGSMGIYADGGLAFGQGIALEDSGNWFGSGSLYIPGKIRHYIEPLSRKGRAYLFGGGHVSQALVPVIAKIGFVPVVYEDRERFCDLNLFPGAMATIQGSFEEIADKITLEASDYAIIMTRGHMADYAVLEQVLRTPVTYIGLIGSRRKIAKTHEKLRAAGFGDRDIARIHNPIGLDIGAETPDEIAISIAGELIAHRAGKASA